MATYIAPEAVAKVDPGVDAGVVGAGVVEARVVGEGVVGEEVTGADVGPPAQAGTGPGVPGAQGP